MANVMMSPATEPNPDNWIGVQDPKKRKQIQDRLAQRARRRRLADEAKARSSASKDAEGSKFDYTKAYEVARRRAERSKASSADEVSGDCPDDSDIEKKYSLTSGLGQCCIMHQDSMSLLPIPLNVYSALWKNGEFMNLSCSSLMPELSKAFGPEVPESLRPTNLQRVTLHPPWIDRFPFPRMRENLILLMGVINPEDFLRDLFNMPCFTIEAGGAPWDPKAWKMEKNFKERWGYLWDEDLFS